VIKEASLARIAGVDIPNKKRVEIALTYIFGIGNVISREILNNVKVDLNKRAKDLSSEEITRIRKYIEDNILVEGDLRKKTNQDIKRLMDINSYRGRRHKRGMPVRGQRTKTNAKTRRGPAGSIKR
jgi:small subunit ribosomal protein S13